MAEPCLWLLTGGRFLSAPAEQPAEQPGFARPSVRLAGGLAGWRQVGARSASKLAAPLAGRPVIDGGGERDTGQGDTLLR